MLRYWIASFVVTVVVTLGLFAVTEYFWIYSILLMGAYTGIGLCLGEEEKISEQALQDENSVVE